VTLSRDHGSHGLTEVHVRGYANKSHVCRTKWYELFALLIERVGVRVVPKEYSDALDMGWRRHHHPGCPS
jgi:hypothetical protein